MFDVYREPLSEDTLISTMEKQSKRSFGEKEKQLIQDIIDGGIEPSYFQDKLISFSSVIKGMRGVSGIDYIKAVQYCSFIAIGDSQRKAYEKTFPDRVAKKQADGSISASSSFYHRTDLVQKILDMSQIPLHMVFMAEKYKAIQKLSELMTGADSERIQMESADKLLTHLKTPENTKLEIDIGFKQADTIDALRIATEQLAIAQRDAIQNGTSIKSIAESRIIDADIED